MLRGDIVQSPLSRFVREIPREYIDNGYDVPDKRSIAPPSGANRIFRSAMLSPAPKPVQQPKREEKADSLADDGCQRGAEGTHPQRPHQQEVQHDIDDRGKGDKKERMPGIPHAPENGGNKIVSVNKYDAIYAGNTILPGILPDFLRRVEPADNTLITEQEDDHDDDRQGLQQRKQRADHLPDKIRALLSDITGNQDLTGIGESHGDKRDQLQHLSADGNR